MLVHHLMSHPAAVCHVSDKLDQAARIMWEVDCGAIVVVDAAQCAVAMLTDRDICMAAYTQGKRLAEISVGSAMSKSLYSCAPKDTLENVEQLMMQYQLRRIPVLDPQGHPIGILSLNDLARAANHQHPAAPGGSYEISLATAARTLAAVCAPRLFALGPRLA